jgi:hypothetical protein
MNWFQKLFGLEGKGQNKVNKSDVTMENETIIQLTEKLVQLYHEGPKGSAGQPIGFYKYDENAKPIREIGENLDKIGGIEAMRKVGEKFSRKLPHCARNLDMVWDGIGDWMG